MSAAVWQPAYLGIGANLDDPARQVTTAIAELAELPGCRLVVASSLYRSPPMGPSAQPDFVNAVAALVTTLAPEALLDTVKAIERAHGRPVVHERWGPRPLDIDLLMVGRLVRSSERLTLPHPGIAERVFVLAPWAEIAPDLEIPRLGRVAELRARLAGEPIERLSLDSPRALG